MARKNLQKEAALAATMTDVFPETSMYRPDLPRQFSKEPSTNYGQRYDLRDGPKSTGWLGPLKPSNPKYGIMSEYSGSLNGSRDFPTFVPTLNRQETEYQLTAPQGRPPIPTNLRALDDSVWSKSQAWANERVGRGQSPFYNPRTTPPTDFELANTSQDRLLAMRKGATDQAEQNRLANYEHRAFARESVAKDPWMAPMLGVAVPAYAVQKSLPKGWTGNKSRSEPSLEQVRQGFTGIGEGMRSWFR
jgi:hypothetical protein